MNIMFNGIISIIIMAIICIDLLVYINICILIINIVDMIEIIFIDLSIYFIAIFNI